VRRLLQSGVAEVGLGVSDEQCALLERYLALVSSWNDRLRLTTASSPQEAAEVLILRTLAVLPYLPPTGSIVDLGSGAGVPGVTIAALRPGLRIVLVEASRRKAGFLGVVVRELRLSNTEVVNARAEVLGRDPGHREAYDAVVARALAPLPVLVEYALPLLRLGGLAVFPKGAAASDEVISASDALRILGGASEVRPAPSPRTSPVILVRKIAPTPAAFPRRPGVPERRPL
jgi:16S rRNA (guanine527-N7)-methyltransferase